MGGVILLNDNVKHHGQVNHKACNYTQILLCYLVRSSIPAMACNLI